MPTATLAYVEVAKVRPPQHRLRDSIADEALGALADSMAAEGLHQPIGVRGPMADGLHEIMWGHRRWLAARDLGWPTIGAMVHPPDTDPFLASVSENLQRENLTPLEEARIVGTLRERGASLHTTARLLRRSIEWVEARLLILEAPPDIQAAIHARQIPLGVAYALLGIDHPGYRQDLIDQATRYGATVAVAQVWVAEYARDREMLIRHTDGVAELIRRAQAVAAMTDCRGCGSRVEWRLVERLELCPACFAAVGAALDLEAAAPPPGTPGTAP